MSFWDSLFGVSNPANQAAPYYNQIPGMLNQQYGPYTQGGQWAQGQLEGPTSQLLSNPGAFVNSVGANYQASPGFNWQLQQAMMAGNQSAAAGGMAGSAANQQQNMGIATQLANQNYYQYLQNAMGAFNTGYAGAQNIYGIGANAAGEQATSLANAYGLQGQNAAAGQQWQNNMNLTGAGMLSSALFGSGGSGSGGSGSGGLLGKINWGSL